MIKRILKNLEKDKGIKTLFVTKYWALIGEPEVHLVHQCGNHLFYMQKAACKNCKIAMPPGLLVVLKIIDPYYYKRLTVDWKDYYSNQKRSNGKQL